MADEPCPLGCPVGDPRCTIQNTRAADPRGHKWIATREGEPREEDAVCEHCGAFANSEHMEPCPIDLEAVNDRRQRDELLRDAVAFISDSQSAVKPYPEAYRVSQSILDRAEALGVK